MRHHLFYICSITMYYNMAVLLCYDVIGFYGSLCAIVALAPARPYLVV